MKRSQAFPSQYLGKDDVPAPRTATIRNVTQEMVQSEGGESLKPIMYFNGAIKPWILNNINWMTMEETWGDSDNWSGRQIELYVDPNVMFGKERVGGVRCRVHNGQVVTQPSAPATPAPPPATAEPPSAAASPGPVNPILAARSAAWQAFIEATPSFDDAKRKAKWTEGVKTQFPHKTERSMTADDWQGFAGVVRDNYSEAVEDFVPF